VKKSSSPLPFSRQVIIVLGCAFVVAAYCLASKSPITRYEVAHASSSGCTQLDPSVAGWPKGTTVYYSVSALPEPARTQAINALNQWNTANSRNGSYVTFAQADANHAPTLSFLVGPISDGAPSANFISVNSTGAVTRANLMFDLNNVNGNFYDPSQSESYVSGLLKVMLHEIGHTMGLAEAPSPNTAGATVMNARSEPNDIQNNQPVSVTDCDNYTVNSNPQYLPCDNVELNTCYYNGGNYNSITCTCSYYAYQPSGGGDGGGGTNYGGLQGSGEECYDTYEVIDHYYDPGPGQDLVLTGEDWNYIGTTCY
jgi:hypothetical protein